MRCPAPDEPASLALPVRAGAGARWEIATTLLVLAIVVWFYGWTAATEGAFEPVTDGDYYHAVVQGWRAGHVHLSIEPRPEMHRLANPYDPAQNGAYRLPDASFYRGHYFLYFGAAPALTLMLPYAVLTGGGMNTATAVFVFSSMALVIATGLLLAIRRRYFPTAAAWVIPLGVMLLGFGTHFLALARRPMWWELPIAAEVAFFLAALAAWYLACHTASTSRRIIALAGAGLALGLAVGSRPTALFGIALLVPAAASVCRRQLAEDRSWRFGAVAAACGLAVCGVVIGAYNQVRFGSPLEFGQKYQLSGMYEGQLRHFAPAYVWPNFVTYFLQPVRWSWEFPYAHLWTRGVNVRDYVDGEEMSGLLATFPALLLAAGVALADRRRDPSGRTTKIVLPLLGYFAGMAAILHCFFSATERYAAEFGFALGLLAVVGWLALERSLCGGWARWTFRAVAGVAAGVSIVSGFLVSLDYHGGLLQRDNPAAWHDVARGCDHALGKLGLRLGEFSGPRILKVRFADKPAGTTETLWTAIDAAAGERVLVRYLDQREIAFGFVRPGGPIEWGRRLTWEPRHTHTVEVQVPSLYGRPGGWMRGLRSDVEFHERSSVTVWFSGGRALELIVPPLKPGFAAGGSVGADFSGEVKRIRERLYRADELAIGSARPAEGEPVGGVLRLRVTLPDPLAPEGEPLLTMGARYGSDMVFLRDRQGGGLSVAIEHFGEPAVVSEPLPLDRRREHVIAIELPSCRRQDFGAAARGVARVWIDGSEVLRRDGAYFGFDPSAVGIGTNAFGTTCSARFRGWITSAEWTTR